MRRSSRVHRDNPGRSTRSSAAGPRWNDVARVPGISSSRSRSLRSRRPHRQTAGPGGRVRSRPPRRDYRPTIISERGRREWRGPRTGRATSPRAGRERSHRRADSATSTAFSTPRECCRAVAGKLDPLGARFPGRPGRTRVWRVATVDVATPFELARVTRAEAEPTGACRFHVRSRRTGPGAWRPEGSSTVGTPGSDLRTESCQPTAVAHGLANPRPELTSGR